MSRSLWALLASLLLTAACANHTTVQVSAPQGVLAPFVDARFLWISTRCSDGSPALAERTGFSRQLSTEARGDTLRFTYDTTLAKPACVSTELWTLTPAYGGEWRFVPDAVIAQPAGIACGPAPEPERGVLRASGDTFEEVRFRSSLCRGFDALSVYRRVPAEPRDADALVRHFLARLTRRDAEGVAALFTEDGTWVESLSRSEAGAPTSHTGRAAVREHLARMFATTPWLAVELTELERLPSTAAHVRAVVGFRYMDARLAEPMRARYLMVFVGQEIYSAELQLLSDPIPR